MKESFELKWKKDGHWYSKQMNRKTFLDMIESIRVHFYWNNEVSTKLVRILPKLTSMQIDMDRNVDLDVPLITCFVDREGVMPISVGRSHKIMWNILEGSCQLDS